VQQHATVEVRDGAFLKRMPEMFEMRLSPYLMPHLCFYMLFAQSYYGFVNRRSPGSIPAIGYILLIYNYLHYSQRPANKPQPAIGSPLSGETRDRRLAAIDENPFEISPSTNSPIF
jgi:hypothetical protein